MSARRFVVLFTVCWLLLGGGGAVAGTGTRTVNGYDLEDINFAFDRNGVIDAIPQLQRLADLLNAHPGLRITIKGHADEKGPGPYNERLSLKRAASVRDVLEKAGIGAERISLEGFGETTPAAPNKTREGRWINRRVVFDVYRIVDGSPDYYYRDNRFIKNVEEPAPVVIGPAVTIPEPATGTGTREIIDRLNDIEQGLDALRADLTAPATPEPVTLPPSFPRLLPGDVRGMLAGSLGSDTDGHLAGRIEGRIFWPFGSELAVQGGLSGLLGKDRNEYRFDLGLVGRHDKIQLGLFVQGLSADLDDTDDTGTVSQVAATLGYRTAYGLVSVFATHPIKREDVVRVDQRFIGPDLETTETFLHVRKTYGLAADVIFEEVWNIEASFGYVNGTDTKTTGHLQVGHLIGSSGLSAFVRGELNNGRLVDDLDGRILAGVEWGMWRSLPDPADEQISPMVVPPLNYDVDVRTSILYADVNFAPVVSIDVSAVKGEVPLTVTFHGSAHDSDGTVEEYLWDFDDGSTSRDPNTTHTFTEAGVYRVVLTATDNKGVQGQAEVVITAGHNILPVVSIEASTISGAAPLTVSFQGNAYDADGTIESYRWDFGDGTSSTGATAIHEFETAGLFRVVLTVTDNQGGEGRADLVITVGGGNTPPVAQAGADRVVSLRQVPGICLGYPPVCDTPDFPIDTNPVIPLDGTLSIDLDGDQLSYLWRQTSGPGAMLQDAEMPTAGFAPTLNVDATYSFELIVTDGRGGVSRDTVSMRVTFD